MEARPGARVDNGTGRSVKGSYRRCYWCRYFNRGDFYFKITAEKDRVIIRINTVDVYADGITPTPRERKAESEINSKTKGEIILIPKGAGLGSLPEILGHE